MANKDFYEILEVDRNATSNEIKSAYRRLVMKYHPDVNKDADATQKMTEINEAYDVLSDPKKNRNTICTAQRVSTKPLVQEAMEKVLLQT